MLPVNLFLKYTTVFRKLRFINFLNVTVFHLCPLLRVVLYGVFTTVLLHPFH